MAVIEGHKVKLFSLHTNDELANEISKCVKVPLSELRVHKFSDGECNVEVNETVRNHDVYLITSTSRPVNDNYMTLFIMIDAMKRASAHTINVIMPYYGYSRQDRKAKAREPISAKLVADLLQTAGADRVITMDLHAAQIQGFYDIPIDNMQGHPIIANYFKKKNLEDVVVVSPDHGGTKRALKLGEELNSPIAIIDKRRPRPNEVEIMNIVGEVNGKNCILIDDMIDTAGTICMAVKALKSKGAKHIFVAATHGIFSGNAEERLNEAGITEIICTNTIKNENIHINNLKILSVGKIFAAAINCVITGTAMSTLFDHFDPEM